MDGSENDIMFSHVAGTNCHMPAALALDTACGLKALSTKGKNASSVGMPRNSNSSTVPRVALEENSDLHIKELMTMKVQQKMKEWYQGTTLIQKSTPLTLPENS